MTMTEMKHIQDIAQILDDKRLKIPPATQLLRIGQFGFYGELGNAQKSIDDYTLEGQSLLVGALGNAKKRDGNIFAELVEGRILPTELFHIIQADDEQDLRYLYHIIRNTSAESYLNGVMEARSLSLSQLMRLPVPWPDKKTRSVFVQLLEDADELLQNINESKLQLMELFDAGFIDIIKENNEQKVEEFCTLQQGENVSSKDRTGKGSALIIAPQGIIGSCDDPLSLGPAITLAQFGGHLQVRWFSQPIRPAKDVLFIDSGSSQIPLAVVYGALRRIALEMEDAKQAHPSYKELQLDSRGIKNTLSNLIVPIGNKEQQKRFEVFAQSIIQHIDRLECSANSVRQLCQFFISRYLKGKACMMAQDQPVPQSLQLASFNQQKDRETNHTESFSEVYKELIALFDTLKMGTDLDPSDLFWEFIPLLVLKKLTDSHQWQQVCSLAEEIVAEGSSNSNPTSAIMRRNSLIQLLDTCLIQVASENPLLEFLPNLSYQSSLLSAEQISKCICDIDSLDPIVLTGFNLQLFSALVLKDKESVVTLSMSLGNLYSQLIKAVAPQAKTIYDPLFDAGGLLLLASEALSCTDIFGQSIEFQDELLARIAFACDGKQGDFSCNNSLEEDDFAGRFADCAVVLVPNTVTKWYSHEYPAQDPRWGFGAPPPNRCIGAWIQQALSHVKEGGTCVCFVNNAFLHSALTAEKEIRHNMVNAGVIECVISLPGRVVINETAPMSIIIMRKPNQTESKDILFIDAQTLGEPVHDDAWGNIGSRIIPESITEAIINSYSTWRSHPDNHHDIPDFCKSVSVADILDNSILLTPWTYIKQIPQEPQQQKKTYPNLVERRKQLEESLLTTFSRLVDSAQNYRTKLSIL